jgi:hypothetical protein
MDQHEPEKAFDTGIAGTVVALLPTGLAMGVPRNECLYNAAFVVRS